MVKSFNKYIYLIVVYEGAFSSIISLIAWKSLGSPQLVFVTQNMLAFNKRTSQPLGILPQLPISLEGKNVYADVMVVQCPMYFNLLLELDYVCAMNLVISTLSQDVIPV